MGGVIGAVSGKFILAASGLFISSTVDLNRVKALIDPAADISTISPRLASKIVKRVEHPPGSIVSPKRPIGIGIRRERFDINTLTVAASRPDGVDLVLGRDVLGAHVFDIDLKHNQLRLVLGFEYRLFTHNRTQIPLTPDGRGGWGLSIAVDGTPTHAVLQLANSRAVSLPARRTSASAEPVDIGIGSAVLRETDVGPLGESNGQALAVIGLKAFHGHHLTLDLPHNSLWLTMSE